MGFRWNPFRAKEKNPALIELPRSLRAYRAPLFGWVRAKLDEGVVASHKMSAKTEVSVERSRANPDDVFSRDRVMVSARTIRKRRVVLARGDGSQFSLTLGERPAMRKGHRVLFLKCGSGLKFVANEGTNELYQKGSAFWLPFHTLLGFFSVPAFLVSLVPLATPELFPYNLIAPPLIFIWMLYAWVGAVFYVRAARQFMIKEGRIEL